MDVDWSNQICSIFWKTAFVFNYHCFAIEQFYSQVFVFVYTGVCFNPIEMIFILPLALEVCYCYQHVYH